jgi:hypothetical protein
VSFKSNRGPHILATGLAETGENPWNNNMPLVWLEAVARVPPPLVHLCDQHINDDINMPVGAAQGRNWGFRPPALRRGGGNYQLVGVCMDCAGCLTRLPAV